MWNGAFSDSEVCAECFGGIMASSRSEDGSDDSAIQFVDVTKSLSSNQLRLHYVVYNCLNRLLVSSDICVNVGLSSELVEREVWFAALELRDTLGLPIYTDLNILYRQGLITSSVADSHSVGKSTLPYTSVIPTTFGILLYASAHNRYDEWQQFDSVDFGDFHGIELPKYYCDSLEALLKRVGPPDAANASLSEVEEDAIQE